MAWALHGPNDCDWALLKILSSTTKRRHLQLTACCSHHVSGGWGGGGRTGGRQTVKLMSTRHKGTDHDIRHRLQSQLATHAERPKCQINLEGPLALTMGFSPLHNSSTCFGRTFLQIALTTSAPWVIAGYLFYWTRKHNSSTKNRYVSLLSISFFIVFHRLTVVKVSFCSLIKRITQKIRMLCFVLINNVALNLLCVWILF